MLILHHVKITQLLKQAAEYKLQVKVMKEQEIDMKAQVRYQGITGETGLFSYLPGEKYNVLLPSLLSLICIPRSLTSSRARYQRVTVSTAASNRTWTK